MDGILTSIAQKKITVYHAGAFLLALLFCTALRISLLAVYPLLVLMVYTGYKWKLDRNAIILLVFVLFTWLFAIYRHDVPLKYNFVSLYFFVPFLLLLFAKPGETERDQQFLKLLMYSLTFVAVINNLFGIAQYIRHPYDDSFQGVYGTFTVTQNGLAVINAVLFFYHLNLYQHRSKRIHLWLAIFFIVCSVMGFYGAGMMAFLGAVILTFLKVRLKNIVQLFLLLIIITAVLYFVMKLVSPLTLDYNINILKMFLDPSAGHTPRKLIIFKNYYTGYTPNLTDLLFGSGPGTFNSRSAFMVGSPTYFNLGFIKSDTQPFYFGNYAYPLWNPSNTGPYDGFMNQPFSSLLAILGEYGLILTLGILYVAVSAFRKLVKTGNRLAKPEGVSTEFKMFKFCSIFVLLLLVIDNYMEYPEIIALLLIISKLSHQHLKAAFNRQEIGAATRSFNE